QLQVPGGTAQSAGIHVVEGIHGIERHCWRKRARGRVGSDSSVKSTYDRAHRLQVGTHGMTRPQIQSAVAEILSITVGRDLVVTETVERDSVPSWDSLKHVELIFMLEERFRIQFREDEMSALRSSEEIVHSIEEKRAA